MSRDPRDVVLPFFKRIEEKAYFTGFQSAVDEFISKVQKRAIEKRKEMDAERLKEKRAGIICLQIFILVTVGNSQIPYSILPSMVQVQLRVLEV